MRIKIGPYKSWIGPYQIAEKICFWSPKIKDEYGFPRTQDWVHDFGTWLAEDKNGNDTWLTKLCQWVDSKKKRKVKIHIDRYDIWSMDHTLAMIVLPMLKQLKESKHGSAMVDPEDVPESMRFTDTEDWDSQLCFDFYKESDTQKIQCDVHDRWDWVLNEMIFAFESYTHDWEEKYRSGEHDMQWKKLENGCSEMVYGPNNTYECDYEGLAKEQKRIDNGLRLFGTYYQGLWD
jgi:hypothetical protein